jgi:hypothetical protein
MYFKKSLGIEIPSNRQFIRHANKGHGAIHWIFLAARDLPEHLAADPA